jgi:methionyl aminopeptidase
MELFIKTKDEIERLRESGARLSRVLAEVMAAARPGVSTLTLDELAEKLIRAEGGTPVFKGYRSGGPVPFPGSLCISINHEVVHGIGRAERVLAAGDLLKLDIGMRFRGMVSDMARTLAIGSVSEKAARLMAVTEASLLHGIETLRPGASLRDYARAVEKTVEAAGFSVVRDLVGHSVGRELHEELPVPNYVSREFPDVRLRAGMTLALEPMVNEGSFRVELGPDQWTFVTEDRTLSAHFEDTVLVTDQGYEILTRPA